jgi:hypothetical protein
MKRSVASCFVSRGSVASKNPNCAVTVPTTKSRYCPGSTRTCGCVWFTPVRRPFLTSALRTVSAGTGKGRRWTAKRYWSHRHTISLAEAGGTATGGTWTKDGERRQADRIVEFVQALHPHYRQRRIGFLASSATYVPHVLRSKPFIIFASIHAHKQWAFWR